MTFTFTADRLKGKPQLINDLRWDAEPTIVMVRDVATREPLYTQSKTGQVLTIFRKRGKK